MKRTITSILGTGISLLLLSACTSDGPDLRSETEPLIPDSKMQEWVEGYNTATFKMMSALADGQKDNFVYSPLSFSMMFGLWTNGATGETQQEMLQLYGDNISIDNLNTYHHKLIENLPYIDNTITFKIANSVWAAPDVVMKETFASVARTDYMAETPGCAKDMPTRVRQINEWVKIHTDNKIDELLTPDMAVTDVTVVNAIYFDGVWEDKFDPDLTKKATFTLMDKTTKEVDMMKHSTPLTLSYAENETGTKLIWTKYGKGKYDYYAILPPENEDFIEWRNNFTYQDFQNLLKLAHSGYVELEMPRFEISTTNNIENVLRGSMGVNRMFDPSYNELDNFVDGKNMYNNSIIQKVRFKCDEEGSVAETATTITGTTVDEPNNIKQMHLNRPFMFVVANYHTQITLFTGYVMKP